MQARGHRERRECHMVCIYPLPRLSFSLVASSADPYFLRVARACLAQWPGLAAINSVLNRRYMWCRGPRLEFLCSKFRLTIEKARFSIKFLSWQPAKFLHPSQFLSTRSKQEQSHSLGETNCKFWFLWDFSPV